MAMSNFDSETFTVTATSFGSEVGRIASDDTLRISTIANHSGRMTLPHPSEIDFSPPASDGQYYPKVDNLPPEVKNMLQEKRKRVYALKMLLKTEEESLRVYERMLGE